jgi:hypothetical protein
MVVKAAWLIVATVLQAAPTVSLLTAAVVVIVTLVVVVVVVVVVHVVVVMAVRVSEGGPSWGMQW